MVLFDSQTSPAGQRAASRVSPASGARRPRSASETGRTIPPTVLVLLSMISLQVGAALARGLFPTLGIDGTVCVRISFAALVLLGVWRPRVRGYSRDDYGAVLLFGLVIAAMNTAFYGAIARLPLGIAVTLEFLGPLGVAVAGSRRRIDALWILLAATGVLLLAPSGRGAIDPIGVLLALAAAVGWAGYILLNVRIGRVFPGSAGLALAMAVAAVAVLPFGLTQGLAGLLEPRTLLLALAVSFLSTVLPFSFEHAALKRLPSRVFGVLMSLEPGIAALAGLVLLGEAIGLQAIAELGCVMGASIGSARSGGAGTP